MRHLIAPLLALSLLTPTGALAQQAITESQVRAQVQGAVRKPGIYTLPAGSRVAELVARAGGPRPDAQLNSLNLARRLMDGELCYVPSKKETPVAVPPPVRSVYKRKARRAAVRRARPAQPPAPLGPLNLNTATADQLDTLPGLGPGLAAAIVRARKAKGRFSSVEDLREIEGIGKKRFERLRRLVRVD